MLNLHSLLACQRAVAPAQVNSSPSMAQDYLLDEQVKQPVIVDTLRIVRRPQSDHHGTGRLRGILRGIYRTPHCRIASNWLMHEADIVKAYEKN